jgi:hypothetical protein
MGIPRRLGKMFSNIMIWEDFMDFPWEFPLGIPTSQWELPLSGNSQANDGVRGPNIFFFLAVVLDSVLEVASSIRYAEESLGGHRYPHNGNGLEPVLENDTNNWLLQG